MTSTLDLCVSTHAHTQKHSVPKLIMIIVMILHERVVVRPNHGG